MTTTEPEPSPAQSPHTDWTKVLTGVAALIGAIATLTAAVNTFVGLNRKPTPTPLATSMPVLTATPSSAGVQPRILLEDNFSGTESAWDTGEDSDAQWGYEGGKYRIHVGTSELFVWANPTIRHDWADLVLIVEAQRQSGPLDNEYGVLVRYVDRGNFYYFGISGDGQYVVQMLRNNEWSTLVPWAASEHVRQDAGTNLLRVECQGERMRFFVNDKLLTSIEDRTFLSGSIGLAGGTMSETGVAIVFDNLLVRALPDE